MAHKTSRIINRILLLIIFILIGLLAYKTMKPINTVTAVTTLEQTSDMENSEDLRGKVELILKDYLMNNPEIIIDSVEQLQKRKMQEMESKVKGYIEEKKEEIENSNAPSIGNEHGDIIIVSFYDYNCSYCKKGNKYLNQLLEADKNVKVILKPFPILGEGSQYAAKIILAVYKLNPGKFQAVHEAIMRASPLTKEAIENIILSLGLNSNEVEEKANSLEVKEILSKNFELASHLRIKGAPAYIINGKLLPGLVDLTTMQEIISQIRNKPKGEESN